MARSRRKTGGSKPATAAAAKLDLSLLYHEPPQDLRWSSPLEGPAFRYTVVLPLLSGGKEVFSYELHIGPVIRLLGKRFGGWTTFARTALPPLHGGYLPPKAGEHDEPEVDANTSIQVYAPPLVGGTDQTPFADLLFGYLKTIVKEAAYQKQKEIVIEEAEVSLLPARPLPTSSP